MYIPLTDQAKDFISKSIHEGDAVIDSTVGNGHDTAFLARLVGRHGKVFAFDIQSKALEVAKRRLAALGMEQRVEWICGCHGNLARTIPGHWHGKIQAVMFNLGYLPGGDRQVATRTHTTVAALSQALDLLSPTGRISIIAYTGHIGGQEETECVTQWLYTHLADPWSWRQEIPDGRQSPPQLFLIGKR